MTTGARTGRPPQAGPGAVAKFGLFFAIIAGVLVLDIVTKLLVQNNLHQFQQIDIIGSYVRLTFIYNPGAAFGIHLGAYSRQIFLALSTLALGALIGMFWYTPSTDRTRLVSISLICGGAIGNLIDRVRSASGVVDFLDVGVGTVRWPVFNVADMAVTTGAVVLALSLWKEEQNVGESR